MSLNTPQYDNSGKKGLITTSTPGAGPSIPYAGGFAKTPNIGIASQQELTRNYGQLNDAARLDLAQRLKRAGYNVPVTGKYNKRVRDAFLKASDDFSTEMQFLATNDPAQLQTKKFDLTTYLDEIAAGSGAGGPSIVRRKTEYRPETIDAVVTAAFQDLTGRGPNQEELSKYRNMAMSQLGKKENMGQTTYTNVGGGVQEQVTKEAFDPKQFLYSKIAGTDEAKATRVFSFYDAFKKALGV